MGKLSNAKKLLDQAERSRVKLDGHLRDAVSKAAGHKKTRTPKPEFPDHKKLKVVSAHPVSERDGVWTILVMEQEHWLNGQPRYVMEWKGPDGSYGTTSAKFDTIETALARGKTTIKDAIVREDKAKREAAKSPQQKSLERLGREVTFFQQHAGGVVGKNAENAFKLARAEKEAKNRGWRVEWEWDEGADPADHEGAKEILVAVLKDQNGKVLQSLGGIDDPTHNYRRVVEAELALEALS